MRDLNSICEDWPLTAFHGLFSEAEAALCVSQESTTLNNYAVIALFTRITWTERKVTNGISCQWNGDPKSLLEFLLLPKRDKLSEYDLQGFQLFDAILFQCLWKERTAALYSDKKKNPSEFIDSVLRSYREYSAMFGLLHPCAVNIGTPSHSSHILQLQAGARESSSAIGKDDSDIYIY